MSSGRLRDALRTSHFRVAAQFLALFAVTGALVLGLVYWRTSVYLMQEVDRSLRETTARWSQLGTDNLLREITRRTERDPSRHQPAALIGARGERLAGALALQDDQITTFDRAFDVTLRFPEGRERPLRAQARVLPSGMVLVVSQDIHELREFNERLRAVMVGGLAVFVLVGLAGAAAFGLGAHRRLEQMRRALGHIVAGDLSARLPVAGGGDDLSRIARMVNAMLDDLERLMGEVKGVTDGIAHDLRTPLTRLIAGLERAQHAAPDRDALLLTLDRAVVEARTLMQMFTGLLRVAEIEDVLRRDNFVPVDLAAICRDVVEVFEPVAQDKGVMLRLDNVAAAQWPGDANLLFDALSNLVDNAIKFTPVGGQITVRLAGGAAAPALSVADTGPGIAPEERELVLARFFRSERSRHTPGHGLGLSLVAAIARLHHLRLSIGDNGPGCVIALTGEVSPDGPTDVFPGPTAPEPAPAPPTGVARSTSR